MASQKPYFFLLPFMGGASRDVNHGTDAHGWLKYTRFAMSDHSEIDSSASSSGSEESIDLSDSNSEASETILYSF